MWCDLPNDLLEHIIKLLNSPIDLLRFRSVCPKWRSYVSLTSTISHSNSFPLNLPTPTCIDPDLRRPCYVLLTKSTIFKISNPLNTTKSWLVRVEESSKDTGKVLLKDPLCPSLLGSATNTKIKSPNVCNFLDLRVSEVSMTYQLKLGGDQIWNSTSIIKKVVASCENHKDNVSVMALHRRGKLAVFRMSEKKWVQIKDDGQEWSKYIDVAYHNNKFYAVDVKGLSISVDCGQGHKIRHIVSSGARSEFEYYDDRGRYLVSSLGNLLLVDNPPIRGCNVHFNIYKLNEDEQGILVDYGYNTGYGYGYDACAGYHAWEFYMEDHALKPLSSMPPFSLPSTLVKRKKKTLANLLGF
ncbi:hypothetical protein RJT34_28741 [Clitoria ternatea]|uniref:F-box domain-containing protein n=1 Tax=Clitoria ternatea TaxID=43366 RepID=A0AAN9I985_CLITE